MAVTVTQWVAINNRNAINVEPPEKKTFIIVVVVVKPTEEKSDISITNVSNCASSIAKWKNGFVGAYMYTRIQMCLQSTLREASHVHCGD